MADAAQSPTESMGRPKRSNTGTSLARSIGSFTENLVLNSDPAPGFFAATAQATSKAPTFGEIRRGSFGEDGWQAQGNGSGSSAGVRRRSSGASGGSRKWSWSRREKEAGEQGDARPFAPLTEEPTRLSTDVDRPLSDEKGRIQPRYTGDIDTDARHAGDAATPYHKDTVEIQRDSIEQKQGLTSVPPHKEGIDRAHTSGYIPPSKLPWTQSTLVGLKAFWRWFITPFGFCLTIYGLNVVAWGGMLFLLLCGAAPAMCNAPVPNEENQRKMSPAAALSLPGPYFHACEDINSPKRIWIEIDSQILNALFCVTGFGLVPWRFRDLYYLLRFRLASEKKVGAERKMYGLRVLAGIHKSWFRLPGSETLDVLSTREYITRTQKTSTVKPIPNDLESAGSSNASAEADPRLPLPLSKTPADPITSVRARPTKLWLMDFFIWCQCWNTFFQCCLCGFMWGMDRYDRPSWSTGLFVALACIIAGVGGIVSFVDGRKVKRVEGVPPKTQDATVPAA